MSSTILNDIVRDYESVTTAWFNSLFPIAQGVFWTLVLIELIWSAIWWVVDREDGLGVVTALLRKVLAVGFFYALLLNGATWIRAGILFIGFSGARWTKFFTERYLSYVASVGVKLFVLYLIMGVGTSIAARWVSVLDRGGFSPIPFFYVMGGSLVFLFLTWHIPSVASAMMAGAVHLSIADVYYPAMLAGRAGAAGLATAGAMFTPRRSSPSRVRGWSGPPPGGR